MYLFWTKNKIKKKRSAEVSMQYQTDERTISNTFPTFRDMFLRFKEFSSRLEARNYSEGAPFKLCSHKMRGEQKVR